MRAHNAHHRGTKVLSLFAVTIVALTSVGSTLLCGCGGPSSYHGNKSVRAVLPGVEMSAPSENARSVLARARQFKLPQSQYLKHGRTSYRPIPNLSSVLGTSSVDAAALNGGQILVHFHSGSPNVALSLPSHADARRLLKLTKSGATFSIAPRGARDASAEFVDGYLVYPSALGASTHVIQRPKLGGFEDYVLFDKKPVTAAFDYDVTLPAEVAGLRLTSNILEFVDANGVPLIHVSPPLLVDSAGKRTAATTSVSGCAVDTSAQPTWKRKPTPPGARSCRISIGWNDDRVQYPALLDPTWQSATAMPLVAQAFNSEILPGRMPQQIAVFGIVTSDSVVTTTTLFFDVDSSTWSVGPPMTSPRAEGSSVSYNNDNTNDGARIFVSGGLDDQYDILNTTETLSVDGNGNWAWQASPPMQTARWSHTATAIPTPTGAQILLAGGFGVGPYDTACDAGPSGATAELYDTGTGAFVDPAPPNLPVRLWEATAALSGDGQAVIIMSGYNGQVDSPSGYCSNSTTVLAYRGGQWLTLPSMPLYRIAPNVLRLNDGRFMVVAGDGYTDSTEQTCEAKSETQLFTYSATAPFGTWTTADPIPVAGSDGQLVSLSNGAVLFGPIGTNGTCDYPSTPSSQIDLFDPQTGHWSRTIDASVAQYYGALATVRKSTGDAETVLFGGSTAYDPSTYWTNTDATEILTLTPNGQPCNAGPECVSGSCVAGYCQPPGFPITIDATVLSNKGLIISGYSSTPIDITQQRTVNLAAGTYTLQVYSGVMSSISFTVTSSGNVDYDPSLQGVLDGEGTTTLKVNGRPITLDATRLSQSQLMLLVFNYVNGVESDAIILDTRTPQDLVLLPLPSLGYQFVVGSGMVSSFVFNVDTSGAVQWSPTYAGNASAGATTLTITGAQVSVTPYVSNSSLLFSSLIGNPITIPAAQTSNLGLLPLPIGTLYKFMIGSTLTTFGFDFDTSGNFAYDTTFDGYVQGRGTNALTINAPTIAVDGTADGAGQFQIGGVGTFDRSQRQTLQLLPVEGGYQYSDNDGSTGIFDVTENGTVQIDSSSIIDGEFAGQGSTILVDSAPNYCGIESANASANGWLIDPLLCEGDHPEETTGTLDAPVPLPTPAAHLTGSGRFPNQLPPHQKIAGGDPVLSDGEFFLQRTDAELAGYGPHYQFRRTYRSGVETGSPLGPGWNHNYNQRIIGTVIDTGSASAYGDLIGPKCDDSVDFQDGEGSLDQFVRSSTNPTSYDNSQVPPEEVHNYVPTAGDLRLEYHTRSIYWRIVYPDGTASVFDQAGFLKSTTDLAGNALTFTWDRPTAPTTCTSDDCLRKLELGQHRRLASVTDAARTVNYIYTITDSTQYDSNNPLSCISIGVDCSPLSVVLASFTTDPYGRLTDVAHGPVGSPSIEHYKYFNTPPVAPQKCLASADIDNFCYRLCTSSQNTPLTCNGQGWDQHVQGYCQSLNCCLAVGQNSCPLPPTDSTYDWAKGFPIGCSIIRNTCSEVLSCEGGNLNASGVGYNLCAAYLYGYSDVTVSNPTCIEGCEYEQQCHEKEQDGNTYAIWASGTTDEMNNNITDVYDQTGALVVHNDYGPFESDVSYGRVVTQVLGSGTGENTLTFKYHDLLIEAGVTATPIYAPSSEQYSGPYSTPDLTVDSFVLPQGETLDLCPRTCGNGDCSVYNYGPPITNTGIEFYYLMAMAVEIHDLHGVERIQYTGADSLLYREVNVNTNEVTDYNYQNGLTTAIRYTNNSGRRECIERDTVGRVVQSSVVPATEPDGTAYPGSAITQATTFSYDPNGQLTDVVRDALGTPVHTHYGRDSLSRVTEIDQDVMVGSQPLHTYLTYDLETPPTGILETPNRIIYPNNRADYFTSYDFTMGGPKTILIDGLSAVPENRYATYDNLGRVTETGEVGRFAQQFKYEDSTDIWRLSRTGHNLLSGSPNWIYTTIASHVVNGETVVDSVQEPTRTTSFTNAGRYPTQTNLTATPPATGQTQTTCFNYSADGRLEAAVLPEGNALEYSYQYGTGGTTISAQKGFDPQLSGSWMAGCTVNNQPQGDPGKGLVFERTFAPGGFIAEETDANFVSHTFTTDGLGRVIQILSATSPTNDAVQQFGYDSAGHRVWEALLKPGTGISTTYPYHEPSPSDSNLVSLTKYEYDLAGRVTKQHSWVLESPQQDLLKTFTYDDLHSTVTVIDRGVTTTMVYDGRGRLTSTTLPDTSVTTITHQLGADVVTAQSNTNGNITRTYAYDTRGLLQHIYDESNIELYGADYDDDGNQTDQRRIWQGQVTWNYDAFGRLAEEDRILSTNPTVTATSTYTYDRNNRLTDYVGSGTDAGPNSWHMTFTGVDAPLTITDPLGRMGTYTYSAASNWPRALVATVQEPNTRTTSFAYDADARLLDVYNSSCALPRAPGSCDGVSVSQRHFTYDERSNIIQVDAPNRLSVSRTYDSIGRLVTDNVGTDTTVQHPFSFGDNGRTITTNISYGTSFATLAHHYDGSDRLATVDLNGVNLAAYNYDNSGANPGIGGPISLQYSNGAKTTYAYDGKLRQIAANVSFGSDPTIIASFKEALGADSIPRMRQHVIGPATWTDAFQVDSDGRITGENLLLTSSITMPTTEIDNNYVSQNGYMQGTNARGYGIDDIGNIKHVTTSTSTLMHTVDQLSRLTSVTDESLSTTYTVHRDGTDNLTSEDSKPVVFGFDQFAGTLTNATNLDGTQSTFEYDALDRRRVEHRPEGDRVFIWDGNQVIGHTDPRRGTVVLDVPGDDIDEHIASVDDFGSGSQWFYHQTPDQSIFAVTGSAGLVEGYTYSAFGELSIWDQHATSQSLSVFGNIFQYQGQVYDDLTATYSMRARQYQPSWGRFVSSDPIGIAGGPSLYAFTGSHSLSERDPSGLLPSNWKTPSSWLAEWMSTWNPDPGAAGEQFLFAPISQVQFDLQNELLGSLNAFAGSGTTYYLENGEIHRTSPAAVTVTGAGVTRDGVPVIGDHGNWVHSFPTGEQNDDVIGTVTSSISVAGRLYPTDRVVADRQGFMARAADWIVDHPYKSGALIFGGVFTLGVGGGVAYGAATGTLTIGAGATGGAAASSVLPAEQLATLAPAAQGTSTIVLGNYATALAVNAKEAILVPAAALLNGRLMDFLPGNFNAIKPFIDTADRIIFFTSAQLNPLTLQEMNYIQQSDTLRAITTFVFGAYP